MAPLLIAMALLTLWLTSVSIAVAGRYGWGLLLGPTLFFLLPAIWILRKRVTTYALLEAVRGLDHRAGVLARFRHALPGALIGGTLAASGIAAAFMPGRSPYAIWAPLLLVIAAAVGAVVTIRLLQRDGRGPLRTRDGVRAGAATGGLATGVALIVGLPIAILLRQVKFATFRADIADMYRYSRGVPAEAREALQQAVAVAGGESFSSFAITFLVGALFLFGPMLVGLSAVAGGWSAKRVVAPK